MKAMSEGMRNTLAALMPFDNTLHGGGVSAMEVEQSGGTRSCLNQAVKKGWAKRYGKGKDERKEVLFYITEDGIAARTKATFFVRFVLEIDCSALEDPHADVARFLTQVAARVENGKESRGIYDDDDREIGRFAFEEGDGSPRVEQPDRNAGVQEPAAG